MIAGGTDRARREEMPGSKVTSAPRAPVPARANTGRWAGLSTMRRPERAGLPGWSKVTSAPRAPAGVGREGGARGARLWRAGRSAAGGGDAAASDLQIKGGGARQGTVKGTAAGKATGLHLGQGGRGG